MIPSVRALRAFADAAGEVPEQDLVAGMGPHEWPLTPWSAGSQARRAGWVGADGVGMAGR